MAASSTTLACFLAAPKASRIVPGLGRENFNVQSVKLVPSRCRKAKASAVETRELSGKRATEKPDLHAFADSLFLGKMNGRVFQQSLPVRSYDIGRDGTTSMESFVNYVQETALNSARMMGVLGTGFGSTEQMSKTNLIWVMTKMHIVVNRYPSWGDVVEVENWGYANGKNGMFRDWHFRNRSTGETLALASGSWVMMNTSTRRLARITDDVRADFEPDFVESCVPILEHDARKLPKLDESTADYIRKGITPRWCDLDFNQHVNNTKYIGWLLESCVSMLETHEVVGLTMEYRKECLEDSVMQSLTALSKDCIDNSRPECVHLLRLDDGSELVRARTTWRPKHVDKYGSVVGV